MAPGRSSRGVQNVFTVPLLTFLFLLSNPKQVAALTTMEGTYIIGAIFFLFVVVDIFLLVLLCAWIRSEIAMKDYNTKKDMIRQRSIECLDAGVKLQIKRKPSSPDSESSIDETSFSEDRKVNDPDVQEAAAEGNSMEPNDYVEVFVEEGTVAVSDKSFEERKKEAQLIRPNTRTESETPLLMGDVNVEESLKLGQILSTVEETKSLPQEGERPQRLLRLQSSDYRRDNKAPLLDNEINIEGGTPPSPASPVKHDPIHEEEEEGDIRLVSLASRTTGPIIPTDSPPHSIPREIQSLDVTVISGTKAEVQITETSFTTDDPQHSTSGTSIGWSSVFQLIDENNVDVEETIQKHGGQLAPETLLSMSAGDYFSNTSVNSTDNETMNLSLANASTASTSCPASNHERAFSFDDHGRTSSFDRSYPPYLTPQHVVPRPRGRSNPGQSGSLSLTSSPARTKH